MQYSFPMKGDANKHNSTFFQINRCYDIEDYYNLKQEIERLITKVISNNLLRKRHDLNKEEKKLFENYTRNQHDPRKNVCRW